MSDFLSFAEILESTLRTQIRAEIKSELESKIRTQKADFPSENHSIPPSFHSPLDFGLLDVRMNPLNLPKDSQAQLYHKHRRPPPTPKPHTLTESQKWAYDNFAKLGKCLMPSFSLKELKKSFRELSKQHHPDHGGNVTSFILLRQSYNNLLKLF